MRLLALGDTQIGVQTVTLESQAQVLDRIADVAIEQNADLVLHGGDVFEGPVVLPEHLRVFIDFATRLREAGISLLVLRGNGRHDMATREVHALDVLREVDGITVSDRPESFFYGSVFVATLPWTKRAREDNDAEQLVAIAGELLNGTRRSYSEEPDAPRILLAHWSISGALLPTGLPVDQLRDPVIEWAELDALGFDCVIASHIHKAQRLDKPELGDATMGVYTGSPQPLNHGESGYEHGVWIIDVEAGACSLDFIEIESPQFVTHDVDIELLAQNPFWPNVGAGDIVRVRYDATREQEAALDKGAISRALIAEGAARVDFRPNITREVRARVETMTQELGPLEAITMYGEAQGLDVNTCDEMRQRLREWIA